VPENLKSADRHRVNQRDALRPVGDIDRRIQVVEEDADNFTETERDDGQIVAAQLERWRTEQDAKDAGNHGANRQNDPERQVQAEMRTGQQRVNVSAHGIEGDVTEIEQAGKADDDVQAKRQEDIQDGEIQNAHPGLTAHRRDEGQGNQGDGNQVMPKIERGLSQFFMPDLPIFSPNRPEGLNIKTPISTTKAKIS
jgi:hypothetical protein